MAIKDRAFFYLLIGQDGVLSADKPACISPAKVADIVGMPRDVWCLIICEEPFGGLPKGHHDALNQRKAGEDYLGLDY